MLCGIAPWIDPQFLESLLKAATGVLNYINMVYIIVPTLNAAEDWRAFSGALRLQVSSEQVLIVDSASNDGTDRLALQDGFRLHSIRRSEFNHGGTRLLGLSLLPDSEIVVYMTQDAVLVPGAIQEILSSFSDPTVGAAYGRQLPLPSAKPIEEHGRYFNYAAASTVRTFSSKSELGFKAIFISNSFAAYRRTALEAVGGFPSDTIFGEDTITAAKLLKAGWKLAYVAEAQVYHSHSYTWRQEFRRYFDIGVLHSREHWLIEEFGGASGEGGRFVRSELRYLWSRAWWLIPSALIRTTLKLLGYRLGKLESRLPNSLKRRISMNRGYWK